MRTVPRRPVAVLLVTVVSVGVAGITHIASAGSGPPAKAAATSADRPPLPPKRIPQQRKPTGNDPVKLLVGLKKGVNAKASAARLERSADVEADAVTSSTTKSNNAITVQTTAAASAGALADLRRDPSVAFAEVNGTYYASAVEPNDPWAWREWNLPRTNVPNAWDTTTGSSDLVVAVIDTGVTAVPELAGALLPGRDFVHNNANPVDDEGHGTMVASLIGAHTDNGLGIAGVCWTCRILPVKVLDADGAGSWEQVAAGINWAVQQHANIINLSLGGLEDSQAVRAAIKNAVDQGILVVAAAGNSGGTPDETRIQFPAGYPSVLAVGGTDENDQRYDFSSRGQWVDLAAPGFAWMDARDGEPLAAFGTSFSAPLVAGAAALVWAAHPEKTAAQLQQVLVNTATVGDGSFAHGRVDVAAAVASGEFTGKTTPSVRITGPVNPNRRAATVIGVATGADTVSVQGLDGTTDLGTDTAAPWALTWNPDPADGTRAPDGQRTVQVVVTDASGDQTTVPVTLTLDRTLPTVTGAAPAQNARRRGVVTVTATGVADAGGVTSAALYVDGRWVGADPTAPYAVPANLSARNGAVQLQWRITDRAGNIGLFNRTIIADNTGPTVRITSGPKNKAKVKGTVKLAVAARDTSGINRVELLINGKKVATDTTAAYTFSIKVAKYGKKLKVQVRAYDSVGNVRYDTTRNWKR